jgi:hypothetical protein
MVKKVSQIITQKFVFIKEFNFHQIPKFYYQMLFLKYKKLHYFLLEFPLKN